MMKKLTVLALSVLLFACSSKEFKIEGEINGLANGTLVFLEKQDVEKGTIVKVDSAKITDGKYTFTGKVDEPQIHSIRFDKQQGNFILILENGTIQAKSNKDSIPVTKLKGTFNNDEFMKYNDNMMAFQKKLMPQINKNMMELQKASQAKDTATFMRISKENEKIQESFIEENYKYIVNSPKSFLSILLIEGMFNEVEPKTEKIKQLFDGLDGSIKDTKPGKKVKLKLENLEAVAIGNKAPDFSANTPDGKKVSLKESLGKVTIIDFWASWCQPCRMENPNMVALYNDFKAKGLKIVGVSLDGKQEAANWKEAIKKDGLTWTQISTLEGQKDPIAEQYGVKSIPATFILDASGKIVAKNLRGAELRAKVAELLK